VDPMDDSPRHCGPHGCVRRVVAGLSTLTSTSTIPTSSPGLRAHESRFIGASECLSGVAHSSARSGAQPGAQEALQSVPPRARRYHPVSAESPPCPRPARRLLVDSTSCRSERSGPRPRSPPGPTSVLPRLHLFSPLYGSGLALLRARKGDWMGSEWRLAPLRIGSTTAEVSAIHWFVACRLRGRRQSRHRRSVGADERRSAAAPARWCHIAAGRANRRPRTRAPPCGGVRGEHGGRACARTASDAGPEHRGEPADDHE